MNEDEVEERQEGLILVGFGKHELKDMLEWAGTDKEDDLISAFKKWPQVWRREGICTLDEITTSLQYMAFLQDAVLEYELSQPQEEDKENIDGNC